MPIDISCKRYLTATIIKPEKIKLFRTAKSINNSKDVKNGNTN